MGGSFNPLSVILKKNKLTRPNYIDWKKNLNPVLTAKKYKFVLTDVCPSPPNSDSSKEEVEAYQQWKKADEMTRYYILASMSNILQHLKELTQQKLCVEENGPVKGATIGFQKNLTKQPYGDN